MQRLDVLSVKRNKNIINGNRASGRMRVTQGFGGEYKTRESLQLGFHCTRYMP
jgi:hypothetical protein